MTNNQNSHPRISLDQDDNGSAENMPVDLSIQSMESKPADGGDESAELTSEGRELCDELITDIVICREFPAAGRLMDTLFDTEEETPMTQPETYEAMDKASIEAVSIVEELTIPCDAELLETSPAEVASRKGEKLELVVKDYQRNNKTKNVAGILVDFADVKNIFVPRSKVKGNFPGPGDRIMCTIARVAPSSNFSECKVELEDVVSLAAKPALLPRKVEAREQATQTWSELEKGQVLDGTIRKVDCDGALVNCRVGNLEIVGELPYAEISDEESLAEQAARLPAPGQSVKVVVLSVDTNKRKLVVSLKRAILCDLPAGQMMDAVVLSIRKDDHSRTVRIEAAGLKLNGKLPAENGAHPDGQVGSTVPVTLNGALHAQTIVFTRQQS